MGITEVQNGSEEPKQHEQLDESEVVSSYEFYKAACGTLLKYGKSLPDQFSYHDTVDIIADDGTRSSGKYGLNDYYVGDSAGFPSDGTNETYVTSAKKALVEGTSILSIQLKDAQGDYIHGKNYLLFWPYKIKPDSWFDFMVNSSPRYPERKSWIPEGYPKDKILILHGKNKSVSDPEKDPQLNAIYKTFLRPREQSSHPSPSAQ